MNISILKSIFDKLCDKLGFDYSESKLEAESKKTSHHINIITHDLEENILKLRNYIVTEQLDYAIIQLDVVVHMVISIYNPFSYTHLKNDKQDIIELIEILSSSIALYDNWLKNDYSKTLEYFKNNDLFKEEEINSDNIDPEMFLDLKSILDNTTNTKQDLLKTYVFKRGKEPISEDILNFQLNKEIVISDSVSDWLNIISRREDSLNTRVTLFLKIEDIEDYSYFLFVVHYKDSIFLITDQTDFDNPHTKESSRSPRRKRDNLYNKIDLPYGLIDELDNIRGKNVLPRTVDMNLELYFYSLSDLPVYNRAYISALMSQFLEKIKNEHTQLSIISSFDNYINQKMIGEHLESLDVENNSMELDDESKNEIDELIETLEEEQTTAIAKITKDLVLNAETYDKNWLATPEKLDGLVKYYHYDSIYNEYAKKLETMKTREFRENARIELQKLVDLHRDNILKFAFTADESEMEFIDKVFCRDSFRARYVYIIKEKDRKDYHSCDASIGITLKDNFRTDFKCSICDKVKAQKVKKIVIQHYEELMVLFGFTDRKQLPKYYRQYRSNNVKAYRGNSILNDLNPLNFLKDPCSQDNPNGLHILIYMCKRCYKKMVKEHKKYDKSLIRVENNEFIFDEFIPWKHVVYSTVL